MNSNTRGVVWLGGVFFISLLLSACSLLSPVTVDVPCKYRLTCIPSCVPTKGRRSATILVATPDTSSIYDTTKMAYTIRPYQIAYFSRNEWAEVPSQMLRPLIVQTLEDTGHFKAVVTAPLIGQADYVLNTEILEFNQNFSCHIPYFILVIRAQIMKTASNKIIATQLFPIKVSIPHRSPYGGVFAANHATSIMLHEIAHFCLEKI